MLGPDTSCLPHYERGMWVPWVDDKEWVGVGEFLTMKVTQRLQLGKEEEDGSQ